MYDLYYAVYRLARLLRFMNKYLQRAINNVIAYNTSLV